MNRGEAIQAATDRGTIWDVVVIGGGASGLGTAVDAAARGYRTLLLEQADFGKGTSSRSTKLVHGGVRYLRQGNVNLVRESLHERGLLLRNAPHLTNRLGFIVPAYSWADTAMYAAGLKLYDLLAGKLGLGATRILGRDAVLKELPVLQPAGLRGGVCYFDGQFDDARLVIALAKTVFALGGIALNYAVVTSLHQVNNRLIGLSFQDTEGGREYAVRARSIINATGAFADAIRRMAEKGEDYSALLTVSQGAHIVLDRSFLPAQAALMIPKTTDGRVLFAIPWQGHTLVGTTDVPVTEPQLDPKPLPEEIGFILENAGRYLVRAPGRSDILSAFAGLRPLVRPRKNIRSAEVSRDYTLDVSDSGLITLAGGKWTTYRRMGEAAVDKAIAVAGLPPRPSRTSHLRLDGAEDGWRRGSAALPGGQTLESAKLHPAFGYTNDDVIRAVRAEMARTVEDVLSRRTRMLLLNARAALETAPRVAAIMALELGRDAEWERKQVQAFAALAERYLP